MRYASLLRVRHWVKNLLVFVPAFFGGAMLDPATLAACAAAFCAFSAASSFVYVINDLRDVENDRAHPTKRARPIASGAVSAREACVVAAILVCVALALSSALGAQTLAMAAAYVAMNVAYSFGAKDIPIVDIAILAAGFLLRVLYGGAAAGVAVSSWLYLTVIAASFYMALGKRRNELRRIGATARASLRRYPERFMDMNMYMCLSLANVFYALWSAEARGGRLIWTVPFVLLISMRYSLDIEGDSDGDPVGVICGDAVLLLAALCGSATMAMIYM